MGGEKSPVIEKCIKSWKENCPDWEIIEWNESNYDVNKVPFVREAYELKKWAFVSDYARLDIIYSNGGIYLDTDVEILQPIDKWLKGNGFVIFETSRMVNTGLGFGAVKGHDVILTMMKTYENLHCLKNGKFICYPCPRLNTEALVKYYDEFIRNGITQNLDGFQVLSLQEYSEVAVHHYMGTWVDGKSKGNRKYRETKLRKILRNPQNFKFIEKNFGKRVCNVYTFLVYDLMEYGMIHYFKRFMRLIFKNEKKRM